MISESAAASRDVGENSLIYNPREREERYASDRKKEPT
jgi:hypothetical protein